MLVKLGFPRFTKNGRYHIFWIRFIPLSIDPNGSYLFMSGKVVRGIIVLDFFRFGPSLIHLWKHAMNRSMVRCLGEVCIHLIKVTKLN